MAAELVLVHQDFNGNELQNAVIQNLASAPSSPKVGQVYFDTTLNKYRVYAGAPLSAWVNLDGSDLPDGSVTSAKIANGTITNDDIAAAAGILLSKLAVDPLARANHSGSQPASSISDLATTVKAYRLDEFAAPNADVSLSNRKLTLVADPTLDTDAANKRYVDLARAGLRLKDSVRAATDGNITLSGLQTVDTIALQAGDRVLVKNQTTQNQNGIYIAGTGAWTRATDADTFQELNDGAVVWVNQGSQANTTWAQINTLTALTDPQAWTQQGAAAAYTGGDGLTIVGNDIRVGAGTGISVSADQVSIDTAVVTRKAVALIGNGSATAIDVVHNFNNQWVNVEVWENTGLFRRARPGVQAKDANTVTVTFNVAPASNAYRVEVMG